MTPSPHPARTVASKANFDRLARVYAALEAVAFGGDLKRARFAYLDRLQCCRRIVILGEGDGRCLQRLLPLVPHARIDCIDSSAAMLARAARRLADWDRARVTFQRADALQVPLPQNAYDGVVTLFFLDCFTPPQLEALVDRITAAATDDAVWLYSDFAVPPAGWRRWRAQAWLTALYAFFRWQTRLPARALPNAEQVLVQAGWAAQLRQEFQHGLLQAVAFRRRPA